LTAHETLGPRTYAPPPQPFLTGTTADRVEASEATEREIDIAVRDFVVKAFDRATEVLRTRRADLDEGARLLLAQETVTADQFPAIRLSCCRAMHGWSRAVDCYSAQ
jgi:cell division protease FtsH